LIEKFILLADAKLAENRIQNIIWRYLPGNFRQGINEGLQFKARISTGSFASMRLLLFLYCPKHFPGF